MNNCYWISDSCIILIFFLISLQSDFCFSFVGPFGVGFDVAGRFGSPTYYEHGLSRTSANRFQETIVKERNSKPLHVKSTSAEKTTTASTKKSSVKKKKRITSKTTSKPKKKKASKSSIKDENASNFWRNETDTFHFHCDSYELEDGHENDDKDEALTTTRLKSNSKKIEFTIRGNPLPLARHRSKGRFMYNPSAKKQEQFRDVTLHSLPKSFFNNTSTAGINDIVQRDTNTVIPFFDQEESIAVKILFRLKRPKNHFRSSIPGPGRLRPRHATNLQNTRQDVDNLAKFVLDALNGVLYDDDRQIVSLSVLKVMDYEGYCEGATRVSMEVIHDSDIEHWLEEDW